ncbi:MAG: Mbeg1-like protein [Eubacteriales bacterium]
MNKRILEWGSYMGNIMDYVRGYGKSSFQDKKFTIVDSLILSVLVYVKYEKILNMDGKGINGITLLEAREHMIGESWYSNLHFQQMAYELFTTASQTRRYGSIRLFCYEEIYHTQQEIQFAAITFALEDGSLFLAFRGTDDSLVGWKEDFNMGYLHPIPSQHIGIRYLEAVARVTRGPIRIAGHSKGGNIATYVAIHANEAIQKRIVRVYSHDPPGFSANIFRQEGYMRIEGRMHKVIPSSSLIGLLLQQNREYLIIRSNGNGLFQHDPFTWEIEEGKFVRERGVRAKTRMTAMVLNRWLFTMTHQQREKMVNHIYDKINKMEFESMDEVIQYCEGYLSNKYGIGKNADSQK